MVLGGSVTVVGDFTQSRPRLQRIRARYRIHPGYVSKRNGGNHFMFPNSKLVQKGFV